MRTLAERNSTALAAATAGKAEVHIYRHVPDVVGGKPTIYLDGSELARMQGDRYFNILISPGAHVLRADKSDSASRSNRSTRNGMSCMGTRTPERSSSLLLRLT